MCSTRFALTGNFWYFTILDQNIIIMGEQNQQWVINSSCYCFFHLTGAQKKQTDRVHVLYHTVYLSCCLSVCLSVSVGLCVLLLERQGSHVFASRALVVLALMAMYLTSYSD